jgi:multiple sugar transport system ATP-binding protein
VQLENVTRQFDQVAAIAHISFTVPDGEFWVLVGPSGCGKSTILRTIAGLEQATSGDIYIGDRRVNQVPARERDVAMVFQNYALYPHMTVAENLGFGLKMRGSDRATTAARIQAVAKSLGISHLLSRKPAQLSGGQQQRVALGRAIAREPQVFLLDEPLSNLDAQLRDDTRAELKQLHHQLGITTIYVTHDQVEAMTLADQMVVLNQGQIQQIGSPQEIYANPANQMVATFLGSPPMNLWSGEWDGTHLHLGPWQIPLGNPLALEFANLPPQPINLGIRPEHLQVAAADAKAHLTATVTLVEPLGKETLIRGTLTDTTMPIAFQVASSLFPKPGDRLGLSIDLKYVHLFDPVTGARLVAEA